MVKKMKKYLKFVVCCALILSLIAPSYAALSASDGSAFVTKAEFDSALADFNSRLTTFEAGINSKIDSQVTSYLDRNGIWNRKNAQLHSLLPAITFDWNNAKTWAEFKANYNPVADSCGPIYRYDASTNTVQKSWESGSVYAGENAFNRMRDVWFRLGKGYGPIVYSQALFNPQYIVQNIRQLNMEARDHTYTNYSASSASYADPFRYYSVPLLPIAWLKVEKSGLLNVEVQQQGFVIAPKSPIASADENSYTQGFGNWGLVALDFDPCKAEFDRFENGLNYANTDGNTIDFSVHGSTGMMRWTNSVYPALEFSPNYKVCQRFVESGQYVTFFSKLMLVYSSSQIGQRFDINNSKAAVLASANSETWFTFVTNGWSRDDRAMFVPQQTWTKLVEEDLLPQVTSAGLILWNAGVY